MTQYSRISTDSNLSKRQIFFSYLSPEVCYLSLLEWRWNDPLLARREHPLVSQNWLSIVLLINSNFFQLFHERCVSTEQAFCLSHSTEQGFVVLTAQRKMTGTDSGEVAAAERNPSEWPALRLQVKQTTHSSFAESSLNRWSRSSMVASEFVKR